MARIGPAEVRERYGVEPRQVPDFIALRGDPSDKLPGANGIGPKGAALLLQRYGTLEQALADPRLAAQAEALRLFKRIATMDAKAPLPALRDQTPTWDNAAALAREWQLDGCAAACPIRGICNRFGRRSPGQAGRISWTRFSAGAEDRYVQRQQRQPSPCQSACLARQREAGRGMPPGTQIHR
jgi:hypothetical protein